MSGHLIGCVKRLDIGKSHKLALVAFADSADDITHIGFPGSDGVQEWAACSKSRAAELVTDLVAMGYLQLHRRGRPGRRAEYIVFPRGCCVVHRPDLSGEGPDDTLRQVLADLTAAGLELTDEQLAVIQGRLTAADENTSEISDQSPPDMSEKSDPSPSVDGNRSEISDQSAQQDQNTSENSGPFTTSTTTPPPPTTGGDRSTGQSVPPSPAAHAPSSLTGRQAVTPFIGRVCQKHGTTQAPNCRGCGTTQRQIDKAEAKAKAEAARLADRQASAQSRATTGTGAPIDLLASTRDALARAKQDRQAAGGVR